MREDTNTLGLRQWFYFAGHLQSGDGHYLQGLTLQETALPVPAGDEALYEDEGEGLGSERRRREL